MPYKGFGSEVKKMVLVYVFSVCVLSVSVVHSQNLGGFCVTPSGESAKCTSIYQCDPLIALLRSPSRTAEETKFLASSKCGFSLSGVPYVCCGSGLKKEVNVDLTDTDYSPNPSIPNRNDCGWQAADRIFNGEATALDEFPWMAVIQYLKPNGQRKISCAGSLINNRYVLTAAHCVTGEVLTKVGRPINVRLGEYDTSSPGRDCFIENRRKFCNQPEINLGIEELIPHPGYTANSNRLHDIALIRLERNVQYSDYVQPVCLPQPSEASATGEQLIVAGWGRTERGRDSNIKLKLQVPVTDYERCADIFRRLGVELKKSQICAGGEDGKDSCTGDSGGPLMRTVPTDNARFMIEGVVSFGHSQCGIKGYPGIYTRVANYVPWIHKTVKP